MGDAMGHIRKRSGSKNYYLRLQYPEPMWSEFGHERMISLRTADRAEAEMLAAPYIAQHKALLMVREKFAGTFAASGIKRQYDDGETVLADGTKVIASGPTIITIKPDGTVKTGVNPLQETFTVKFNSTEIKTLKKGGMTKRKAPNKCFDILDFWISENKVEPYRAKMAIQNMEDILEMAGNPSPDKLTRDHIRDWAKKQADAGAKTSTIQAKIASLNAAFNLAVKENKIAKNPFSSLKISVGAESDKRLPIEDDDLVKMRGQYPNMTKQDIFVWRLLCLTGMRLDEAFQISEIKTENGCDYFIVGSKTDSSLRRVPVPAPLTKDFANHSKLEGTSAACSKRILRAMRNAGICENKVVHSLRHRAKDRLRIAECPTDIQLQLLGHEIKTVASGYGTGYPVNVLAKWQKFIGE